MRIPAFLGSVLTACAATPAVQEVRSPAVVTAPGAQLAELAPVAPKASLPLEPRPRSLASATRVKITAPLPDADLAEPTLADTTIEIEIEHPDALVSGIDLGLDDFRPHRFAARAQSVRLATLLPEDQRLASGEHWLFAVPVLLDESVPRNVAALDKKSDVVLAQRFFVGQSVHSPLPAAVAWCREPSGTFNGPLVERLPVDVHVIGLGAASPAASATITLEGDGTRGSAQVNVLGPLWLRDPGDGDHRLRVEVPGARPAACEFTLNRSLSNARPKASGPGAPGPA